MYPEGQTEEVVSFPLLSLDSEDSVVSVVVVVVLDDVSERCLDLLLACLAFL